ncbi:MULTISPECIES: glycogen debranching protein GlgX [Tsukamurella]|uniref:Glycogen debranching protein GlgX n=2 Tax=Tsukamurella TaxID=2060 RepID=A0A5C5RZL8_9ACTN|nr:MULTISPECIES: glycogen debranching protein GlgX [Tsukamurella]NMD54668.1 glycogen debranching protein GlgX [Tsukamurella columbiensis]TWS28579.1 glycogen debranching protein GlgX [Tsukamurella conjunctivitidis]
MVPVSTDHRSPTPGAAHPLGAVPRPGGVNFAVHAPRATDVWVCLVETDDAGVRREQRLRLPAQTAGVHHGFVAGIGEGARYCLRAAGPWEPDTGLRFNEHKALIDPYARRIDGALGDGAALLPYGEDGGPSETDSLGDIPLCVVTGAPPAPEPGPGVPWDRTVICEVHVGSYTARHPGVPEELRGTYAGLAQPAVLDHLRRIGVTAVELLPVQACLTEPGVRDRGMRNHWGYSTGAYFAPDPRYAARPGREVEEFAALVSALHSAGIEVLMDVVYNHTAEESVAGPSLSWRGLDAPGYYLLEDGEDLDYTGCGNTVDCASPASVRMVLDSLRYFAGEFGVDGFRFDLASVLGRGRTGTGPQGPVIPFDHRAPLLTAIAADPILCTRKLIAEPWDATGEGYRVGGFTPVWAEWNDRYRDTVRDFFAGGATVGALASRVSGSQDLFGAQGRTPFSSINFVTAHDGFTARDLVSYERKHNEANGENNRDGTDNNHSVNHGFEGGTTDPAILAARGAHVRALLATLLLSTGTPMLLAGDELGHTQYGNNNAYCVPEGTPAADAFAVDWDAADADLTAFVARVAAVRRAAPVLRQHEFFDGRATRDGEPDLAWFGADGAEMSGEAWQSPEVRTLQAWVDGSDVRAPGRDSAVAEKDALIVWHAGGEATVVLGGPESCTHDWELIVDTTLPTGEPAQDRTLYPSRAEVAVSGPTVLAFQQV